MISKLPLVEELVELLGKLPGVGKKTALRYALWFIDHAEESARLSNLLSTAASRLKRCKLCRGVTLNDNGICDICADDRRDKKKLCVVENLENLFAIETGGVYNGMYYVLGGLDSSLYVPDTEAMGLDCLVERVLNEEIEEVILVIGSTLEGDIAAQYIKERLAGSGVRVTRVAYGIPVGASVSYVDKNTLIEAFKSRKEF